MNKYVSETESNELKYDNLIKNYYKNYIEKDLLKIVN